jgi:ankyrin repeat protein
LPLARRRYRGLAEKGHKDIVQLLLNKGADLESKSNSGRTPLSWAAKSGDKDIVQLLLDKGADHELKEDYGQTPLSRTVLIGHKEIVQQLSILPNHYERKNLLLQLLSDTHPPYSQVTSPPIIVTCFTCTEISQ